MPPFVLASTRTTSTASASIERLRVVGAALLVAHPDRHVHRTAHRRDVLRVAGRHDVLDPAEPERLERADVGDRVVGAS